MLKELYIGPYLQTTQTYYMHNTGYIFTQHQHQHQQQQQVEGDYIIQHLLSLLFTYSI